MIASSVQDFGAADSHALPRNGRTTSGTPRHDSRIAEHCTDCRSGNPILSLGPPSLRPRFRPERWTKRRNGLDLPPGWTNMLLLPCDRELPVGVKCIIGLTSGFGQT